MHTCSLQISNGPNKPAAPWKYDLIKPKCAIKEDVTGLKKYLSKIQFYVFVYLDEVVRVYIRHINMYVAE